MHLLNWPTFNERTIQFKNFVNQKTSKIIITLIQKVELIFVEGLHKYLDYFGEVPIRLWGIVDNLYVALNPGEQLL